MLNFDPNRQTYEMKQHKTYTQENELRQQTENRNAMGNNKRPLTDCLISIIEIQSHRKIKQRKTMVAKMVL